MSEMIREFFDWLNNSEAALGLIIAVLGAIASAWFSWYQRNLARRQRAANLFDHFYSLENYHAMVAPVYSVTLKWNAFQDKDRVLYASTLCKGWIRQEKADEVISIFEPEFNDKTSDSRIQVFEQDHFLTLYSREEFTEHSSLTAFLYFWVKLKAMIDANLVCKQLVKELFAQPYSIYAQFIANFRQAMIDNPDTLNESAAWIEATRELEILFFEKPLPPEKLDWSILNSNMNEGTT